MSEKFEVRQRVSTVKRTWNETVFTAMTLRVAQGEFETLKAENPTCYFEIVKVINKEEYLDYTPIVDA